MFPPDEAKGWRPKGVLQMDYTQIASRLMVAQGRTQGALILSLVRIPDGYRHLAMHAMHGIPGPSDLAGWRDRNPALSLAASIAIRGAQDSVLDHSILVPAQPGDLAGVRGCGGVPQGSTPNRAGLAGVLAEPLELVCLSAMQIYLL